jgi:hypothetical protein
MSPESAQPGPNNAAIPPDDFIGQLLEGKADEVDSAVNPPAAPEPALPAAVVEAMATPESVLRPAGRRRWLPEWFLPPGGPGDRWAHRRGEPRTFAFLWTLYLLMATVMMFWKVLRTGVPTLDIYRPSIRGLLVAATLGATAVWLMVRMCQESPAGRRVWHALADVMVLMFPLQAVLWPQLFLAQWSFEVILAVDLLIMGWVVATAAVLVRGWELRGGWRAGPVGAWIVVLSAGPLIGMTARALSAAGTGLGVWAMSSPLTGVYHLTHVEAGSSRRGEVAGWEWQAIATTWAVAGLLWALAAARGWGRGPRTGALAPEPRPA